ncbi:MAG: class IV adenylate cyclase [Ferruginibacter sp.]
MAHLNVEFKAAARNIQLLEEKLKTLNPLFKGEDRQVDTYFNVSTGRLKLREGNIENALIWYERENTAGSKQSHILLYKHEADQTLKEILIKTHGIKVIIDKRRRIYFIDNVKFHFDEVKDLGTFIEVEAIDADGSIGLEKITEQCNYYAAFFEIKKEDFQSLSYSDMLL